MCQKQVSNDLKRWSGRARREGTTAKRTTHTLTLPHNDKKYKTRWHQLTRASLGSHQVLWAATSKQTRISPGTKATPEPLHLPRLAEAYSTVTDFRKQDACDHNVIVRPLENASIPTRKSSFRTCSSQILAVCTDQDDVEQNTELCHCPHACCCTCLNIAGTCLSKS